MDAEQPKPFHLGLIPRTLLSLQDSMVRLQAQVDEMLAELRELRSRPTTTLDQPVSVVRTFFSVEEVAGMVGRSKYSVREWARNGQVNAVKRAEKRGAGELWAISADEVARYRNQGLLPIDPGRNRRN